MTSAITGLCTYPVTTGGCPNQCWAGSIAGAVCVDLQGIHPSLDTYECQRQCSQGACPGGAVCHPPFTKPGFCYANAPLGAEPVLVQASLSNVPADAVRVELAVKIFHVNDLLVEDISSEGHATLPGGSSTVVGQAMIVAPPQGLRVFGSFTARAFDAADALIGAASEDWQPSTLALSGALVSVGPGGFMNPGPCADGLVLSPITNLCTMVFDRPGCFPGEKCLSDVFDNNNFTCLDTSAAQPPIGHTSECVLFCDHVVPCQAGSGLSCVQVGHLGVCRASP